MNKKRPTKGFLPLYKTSIVALFSNKQIFFPFLVFALLQLLFLEILYFYPKPPLDFIFRPIVTKIWGSGGMHFPANFAILPEIFGFFQGAFYVLVGSFFTAVAALIIQRLNNDEPVKLKMLYKEALKSYVYIVVAALIVFLCMLVGFKLYDLIYARAYLIRSTSGPFYLLKSVVIQGSQYFKLIITIIFNVLFLYVIPIIVLEKKKLFAALGANFRMVFRYFWTTFLTVFITTLIYVALILIDNIYKNGYFHPEVGVLIVAAMILVTSFIHAVIFTAGTTYYLMDKEG